MRVRVDAAVRVRVRVRKRMVLQRMCVVVVPMRRRVVDGRDHELPVQHALRTEYRVRDGAHEPALATQDGDLEAHALVEVHVRRGDDAVAMLVLYAVELVAQVVRVVVEDYRERADDFRERVFHLLVHERLAHEIADGLGAVWRGSTARGEAVELLEQGIGNRIVGLKNGKVYDIDIQEGLAMKKPFIDDRYDIFYDTAY